MTKKMGNQDFLLKSILVVIAVGIWMLVLQNFNVFDNERDVYVRGGYINSDVSGSVDIDNTVDINLKEILGQYAGARRSYVIDGVQYNSLDVSVR